MERYFDEFDEFEFNARRIPVYLKRRRNGLLVSDPVSHIINKVIRPSFNIVLTWSVVPFLVFTRRAFCSFVIRVFLVILGLML